MGDKIIDWLIEYILPWVIIGGTLLIPLLIFMAVREMNEPTLTLQKDLWECTNRVHRVVGKVITSECMEWSRK